MAWVWVKALGHDIEVGLGIANQVSPLLNLIPGIGPIAATVIHQAWTLEQLIPVPGQGTAKKAAVVAFVNAVHPGLDQAKLSADIDQVVGILNSLDALLGKIGVPVPAPI